MIGLISFRHDENSSFLRGAADAPPAIKKALFSDASNLWSESGMDLGRPDVFFEAGDVFPDQNRSMTEVIEESIAALCVRNLRPLALGGDHAITYPIVRALSKKHPRLSILHFDAHPDLYDEFQGNRLSHACPFARIMEEKLVGRLVQVGIRTMNAHQRKQASRFGVEVVEMKDWREGLAFNFDTPVYISVDLDGLDPAFAPGVSHPEPGGLTTRQVITLIQNVEQMVVGADVVEYNPRTDVNNLTATVCAKLVKELAAKILAVHNAG
ncbi:MAG TPA: agmatinase [Pyrinomonadaceae bacterium]|jgi:agmatinase|nr:agmatinase [Pyrinomonadaceae bacterium]